MSGHELSIAAHEVSARVLARGRVLARTGPSPKPDELSAAVCAYLAEHQPWLSARVAVRPGEGGAVVVPMGLSDRPGENGLSLLRAVEGALGMADKLPEMAGHEQLPQIEVDAAEFVNHPVGHPYEPEPETELLSSHVRYFPLPTCEWFEVCDGRLVLLPDRIVFEPRYEILPDDATDKRGSQVVPLAHVREVRRDEWWCVPCVRVQCREAAYRYGWPAYRTDPAGEFELDEWLAKLGRMLDEQ